MRNKHKKFIRTELDYLFEKAKETITKASPTDASRISGVFQNLAARAKSPISKIKLVTQVIQKLATALNATPGEVMRSYQDFRKAKRAKAKSKKDEK